MNTNTNIVHTVQVRTTPKKVTATVEVINNRIVEIFKNDAMKHVSIQGLFEEVYFGEFPTVKEVKVHDEIIKKFSHLFQ